MSVSFAEEFHALAQAVAQRRHSTPAPVVRAAPQPAREPTLEDYLNLLARHDWAYEMSDDGSVWRRGVKEREALDAMAARLDPDRAIWRAYVRP